MFSKNYREVKKLKAARAGIQEKEDGKRLKI